MSNIKTKVISIDGSTRRPKIQSYLEEKQIPFEFFNAACSSNVQRDGSTFKYNQTDFTINVSNKFHDSFKGRGWVNIGEIGCIISHYSLWKELTLNNSNVEAFLILEDDAKPLFDGVDLDNFYKSQTLEGVDVIACQCTKPNFERRQIFDTLTDFIRLVESEEEKGILCEGTAGYIITKSGAKKLTSIIEKYGLIFTVDNFIWRCTQVSNLTWYITTKKIQVDLYRELADTSFIHSGHAKDNYIVSNETKLKTISEKMDNGITFIYNNI